MERGTGPPRLLYSRVAKQRLICRWTADTVRRSTRTLIWVDGWLESDRLMPRKQRHTARRIHDRLLSETDYDGEYSTTQRYVRRWRQANQAPSDGYCELDGLATVCWTGP